jgi:very-short-patch-repair endonuclease
MTQTDSSSVGRISTTQIRLVIECDGDNHRDRLVSDLRRQNALVNASYHLLRFTAADLRAPNSVAAQVRQARAMLRRY